MFGHALPHHGPHLLLHHQRGGRRQGCVHRRHSLHRKLWQVLRRDSSADVPIPRCAGVTPKGNCEFHFSLVLPVSVYTKQWIYGGVVSEAATWGYIPLMIDISAYCVGLMTRSCVSPPIVMAMVRGKVIEQVVESPFNFPKLY